MATFEELLEKDERLVYKTRGVSMLPMLHQNRDIVIIGKKTDRMKAYDVALYRRGPSYVLHRVIRVREKDYVIRGDNTYSLEYVPEDAVIGVLNGFTRKGRQHSVTDGGYLLYVRIWCAIYPVRAVWVRAFRMAKAAARKLGIRRPH